MDDLVINTFVHLSASIYLELIQTSVIIEIYYVDVNIQQNIVEEVVLNLDYSAAKEVIQDFSISGVSKVYARIYIAKVTEIVVLIFRKIYTH